MGYVAATYCHLEFLRELDSMGLLVISCKNLSTGETAINAAAFHGRTECVEFLICRLGSEHLGVKDSCGYLPIHLASQRNNLETLSAIIRLHPFYSRASFLAGLFVHGVSSPLQVAVACGATNTAILPGSHCHYNRSRSWFTSRMPVRKLPFMLRLRRRAERCLNCCWIMRLPKYSEHAIQKETLPFTISPVGTTIIGEGNF